MQSLFMINNCQQGKVNRKFFYNFKKWMNGKPLNVALFSYEMAKYSEFIYEILDDVRNNKNKLMLDNHPDLKTWLPMYKTHHHLFDYTYYILKKDNSEFPKKRIYRCNKKNKYNFKIFNFTYTNIVNSTYTDKSNDEEDFSEKNKKLEKIYSKEITFLILVLIPCVILYGKSPAKLLREARCGNYESLEKLIRLYSSIIFEYRISEKINRLRYKEPATHEKLISAMLKPPKFKISRQRIKILMAANISLFSILSNHRLNEPDIRELFDIIAQETEGNEIDTDLPESPEAFSKAIQRELSLSL